MIHDIFFDEPYGKIRATFEENFVHIWGLYITPEFRGKNKAKELLFRVVKAIRDSGYLGEIQIVAASSEPGIDNIRLKSFYEKMGLSVLSHYGLKIS